ncbi:MAG: Bro-N domain-containing protein, partial [Candidatus Fonsibacter sp.]
MLNGNPWFRGKDIAKLLDYADTKRAIAKSVSEYDRISLEELMGDPRSPIGYRDRTAIYINESGLYCLIFGSKKHEALLFNKWVTSEVLPSIRKHGVYETPAAAIELIRNPTGETKLHYKVKKHIETTYPYVIISAGLGENQTTDFIRMDNKAKGY